jgi:hypothetical protein
MPPLLPPSPPCEVPGHELRRREGVLSHLELLHVYQAVLLHGEVGYFEAFHLEDTARVQHAPAANTPVRSAFQAWLQGGGTASTVRPGHGARRRLFVRVWTTGGAESHLCSVVVVMIWVLPRFL